MARLKETVCAQGTLRCKHRFENHGTIKQERVENNRGNKRSEKNTGKLSQKHESFFKLKLIGIAMTGVKIVGSVSDCIVNRCSDLGENKASMYAVLSEGWARRLEFERSQQVGYTGSVCKHSVSLHKVPISSHNHRRRI